jgi:hypothetical protein
MLSNEDRNFLLSIVGQKLITDAARESAADMLVAEVEAIRSRDEPQKKEAFDPRDDRKFG